MTRPAAEAARRPLPRRSRLALVVATLGLGVSGAVISAIPVAHATTEPDFSLEVVAVACQDSLHWQPRFTAAPGVSWTGRFTFTLKGDNGSHPHPSAVVGQKSAPGYSRFAIDFPNSNGIITDVDWTSTTLANPRFEVTWTYGIDGAASNTSTGATVTLPVSAWVDPQMAGSGTPTDPFIVTTPAQVNEMRCYAETPTHFRLGNDIDLSGVDFLPLGGSDVFMQGVIDGAGHTISDMNIDLPHGTDVAFIRKGQGLVVRDLRFANPTVRSFNSRVGVVIGDAYPTTSLTDLTVTNASVSARERAGLLAGETERATILRAHVDGDLTITPEPYVGDPARTGDIDSSRSNSEGVGGLLGRDTKETSIIGGHLDVRITGEADNLSKFGGIIGYQQIRTFLSDFTADIMIDLTVREVGTGTNAVSGMFGSRGLDDWTVVTDAHVMLDMTLRAPSTSDSVRFEQIGGIAGEPQEGTVSRSSVTGSLTIDTSAAGPNVTVKQIGGAFGRVGANYTTRLVESHIDVDVNIIGNAERVGGLIGFSTTGQFIDLRVGGSVSITGDGTEVGGLIGHSESQSSRNSSTVDSVIYRGLVSVSGTQSDVGVLFGNATTSAVTRLPVNVVNTWWDSTVNGVTATDRGLPGSPATAAQLGQSSWLAGAGFNTSVWCAHNGVPWIAKLTTSPCRATTGGDGGSSGGGSSGGGSSSGGSSGSTVVVADRVRIDGADRYGTSAALSRRFFTTGVSVAYLATGTNFADALAAGPIAASSGPILMVRHNEIPTDIQVELTRLRPGRIVVLGGSAAVSDAVVTAARAFTSGTVTRLFGEDRFATAVAISGAAHQGQVEKVYIATGTGFADALAGGPFAAGDGPILLVRSDRIPAATAAELTRLKPQQIIVLGGPSAVSADLMRSLGRYASQSVSRIHGPDRYATSVAISQAAFNPGVPILFLATGTNFADALSAGAASGGNGPVLLVRTNCVPLSVYNEIIRLNPKEIFVLGGTAAVGVGASNLTQCDR